MEKVKITDTDGDNYFAFEHIESGVTAFFPEDNFPDKGWRLLEAPRVFISIEKQETWLLYHEQTIEDSYYNMREDFQEEYEGCEVIFEEQWLDEEELKDFFRLQFTWDLEKFTSKITHPYHDWSNVRGSISVFENAYFPLNTSHDIRKAIFDVSGYHLEDLPTVDKAIEYEMGV